MAAQCVSAQIEGSRYGLHRLPHLGSSLLQVLVPNEVQSMWKEEAWQTDAGRTARTLVKYPDLRIVLVSMKAGTRFKQHKTSARFAILMLAGHVRLHLPSATVEVPRGELLALDRGVSHEIVRHRLGSYSQESTRYCDYSKSGGLEVVQVPNESAPRRNGHFPFRSESNSADLAEVGSGFPGIDQLDCGFFALATNDDIHLRVFTEDLVIHEGRVHAAQDGYGIRFDHFSKFKGLDGVIDGSGDRGGSNVSRHGFAKTAVDIGICMPLGHGIVDLGIQTRQACGSGKVDQTEGDPATGDFIHAAMVGGGHKQDFTGVGF